jgi:methionyl-tRNA formyltransferase
MEEDGLIVACGGGTLLRVTSIQPEGRRVMTARDAVNGRQIRPGDRLVQIG